MVEVLELNHPLFVDHIRRLPPGVARRAPDADVAVSVVVGQAAGSAHAQARVLSVEGMSHSSRRGSRLGWGRAISVQVNRRALVNECIPLHLPAQVRAVVRPSRQTSKLGLVGRRG
jgi:hypothetical protein